MHDQLNTIETFLSGLMTRYKERVPDVQNIISKMVAHNIISAPDQISNDHIAFRTMGVEQLGIKSLEKVFLQNGYTKRDYYNFEDKKLNAFWYAPPTLNLPRIFISELRVKELSEEAQRIIKSYTSDVKSDPVDNLDIGDGSQIDDFLHTPLWHTPTLEDYKTLSKESEYAAWVIYNRYYLNHFTISVHDLPDGYNTINEFNLFLESIDIKLNDSSGKAKISADGMLIQSATVAEMIDAEFAPKNGEKVIHKIPGSYVEFAERKVNGENRREGFEANNADKIFESTYSSQTEKVK